MKKIHCFIVTLLLIAYYLLLVTSPVIADDTCQPIYGGGISCLQTGNIALNKTVQNPKDGNFVDNLNINDPKFSPSQTVVFQLTITNTGKSTINKVTVKDTLAQFVRDFEGSSNPGPVDGSAISFVLNNLLPNESRNFKIALKVVPENQLPKDTTITCVVNQATATGDNNQVSTDNSQFCIQKEEAQFPPTTKGGLPINPAQNITSMPSTGPELLGLLALIPSTIAGVLLRRKTS